VPLFAVATLTNTICSHFQNCRDKLQLQTSELETALKDVDTHKQLELQQTQYEQVRLAGPTHTQYCNMTVKHGFSILSYEGMCRPFDWPVDVVIKQLVCAHVCCVLVRVLLLNNDGEIALPKMFVSRMA
jgi:hypothetical protein